MFNTSDKPNVCLMLAPSNELPQVDPLKYADIEGLLKNNILPIVKVINANDNTESVIFYAPNASGQSEWFGPFKTSAIDGFKNFGNFPDSVVERNHIEAENVHDSIVQFVNAKVNFDFQKIGQLFSNYLDNEIKFVRGKDVFFVNGLLRAGKSLCVNYLLGHEISQVEITRLDENGEEIPDLQTKIAKRYNSKIAKSEAGGISVTRSAQFYETIPTMDGIEVTFGDCPGFNSLCEEKEDLIFESISMQVALNQARSVKALLITIDYTGFESDDTIVRQKLCDALGKFVENLNGAGKSVLFLFTHIENSQKLRIRKKLSAQEILNMQRRIVVDQIQTLKKEQESIKHNDSENILRQKRILSVLNLIVEAKENIFLVNPFDGGESRKLIFDRLKEIKQSDRSLPKENFVFHSIEKERTQFDLATSSAANEWPEVIGKKENLLNKINEAENTIRISTEEIAKAQESRAALEKAEAKSIAIEALATTAVTVVDEEIAVERTRIDQILQQFNTRITAERTNSAEVQRGLNERIGAEKTHLERIQQEFNTRITNARNDIAEIENGLNGQIVDEGRRFNQIQRELNVRIEGERGNFAEIQRGLNERIEAERRRYEQIPLELCEGARNMNEELTRNRNRLVQQVDNTRRNIGHVEAALAQLRLDQANVQGRLNTFDAIVELPEQAGDRLQIVAGSFRDKVVYCTLGGLSIGVPGGPILAGLGAGLGAITGLGIGTVASLKNHYWKNTHVFTYVGPQIPLQRWDHVGGTNEGWVLNANNDMARGIFSVSYQYYNSENCTVRVRYFVARRDLPANQDEVNQLRGNLDQIRGQIQIRENELNGFRGALRDFEPRVIDAQRQIIDNNPSLINQLRAAQERHNANIVDLQNQLRTAQEHRDINIRDIENQLHVAQEQRDAGIAALQNQLNEARGRAGGRIADLEQEQIAAVRNCNSNIAGFENDIATQERNCTSNIVVLENEIRFAKEKSDNEVARLENQKVEIIRKRDADSKDLLDSVVKQNPKLDVTGDFFQKEFSRLGQHEKEQNGLLEKATHDRNELQLELGKIMKLLDERSALYKTVYNLASNLDYSKNRTVKDNLDKFCHQFKQHLPPEQPKISESSLHNQMLAMQSNEKVSEVLDVCQCEIGKTKILNFFVNKNLSKLYDNLSKTNEITMGLFVRQFANHPDAISVVFSIEGYAVCKTVSLDISFRKLLQQKPMELLDSVDEKRQAINLRLPGYSSGEIKNVLEGAMHFFTSVCRECAECYELSSDINFECNYENGTIRISSNSSETIRFVRQLIMPLATPVPSLNALLSNFSHFNKTEQSQNDNDQGMQDEPKKPL